MYYSDYNRPQEPSQSPMYQPPAPERKKKSHKALKVIALILVCALVGGGAGVGGAMLTRQLAPEAPAVTTGGNTVIYEGSGTPAVVNLIKVDEGKVMTAAEVYASNVSSTVGITTQITTNVYGQTVSQAAAGSGFVLTADGYIITNHHVIKNATNITVSFHNGDSYPATVVGTEEENDLAVLKIDVQGLTPVRLGSSSDLVVGEDVVAIGNPLGELTFSMTRGIVSGLGRTITMSDGTAINVLQTDCTINSGNSGGALFNMYGEVIGITNAKYSNNGSSQAAIEGICFAIPIDDVKGMIVDIIEHGYVTGKPYVGVTLSTASAAEASRYGRHGGAYVSSVIQDAAAHRAGLQKGDIITAVDGEEIESHAAFIEIKNRHKAGDTVTLTVDRNGTLIPIDLTFDELKPGDHTGQVQTVEPDTQDRYDNDRGNGYNYGGSDSDRYEDYFGGSIWDYIFRNPFRW